VSFSITGWVKKKTSNPFNDNFLIKGRCAMDQKKTFKKMIELNQTTFDNIFNVTVLVQNRFERIANAALNQTSGIPAEKRKAIENWTEAFKYSRNSFKKQIDKNFEQAEKIFIG
jgi:hypothetical protein